MNKIKGALSRCFSELSIARFTQTEGQALVEYALIIALVALAVVAALGFLGTNLTTEFSSIAGKI